MVIYRTADGQPGYHQADELDEAVRFVERLRNTDGVDGARIFKMEEVNFDFRPYFKVEIGPGGSPLAVPTGPPAIDAGFSSDLGFGQETEAPAPAPAPAFEAPEPWSEPETPTPEPVFESAAALDPEPPVFAPPSAADGPVIDALPTPPPPPAFGEPAAPAAEPAEDDADAANGVGARRGLFGR
jgi:hypothetical protein